MPCCCDGEGCNCAEGAPVGWRKLSGRFPGPPGFGSGRFGPGSGPFGFVSNNNNNNNNNNNRINMASHTMQLAGKRKILHILKKLNSTQRDKNTMLTKKHRSSQTINCDMKAH